MLKDKFRLQIPGPTPIPPRVQQAMSRPMVGHRDPDCSRLVRDLSLRLAPVFGTRNPVLLLAGSGTSALEAAAVNTLSREDEAAVVVTGAFGDRFANILSSMEVTLRRLDIPWGTSCSPEELTAFLKNYPRVKTVFLTYCETSTGVLNPVRELAAVVREQTDALTVVDGVSCIGGVPAGVEDWGIDILVSGSQKALMLPAGLAFAAISDKAWKQIEANPHPRFYLDFRKYRNSLQNATTPFTPTVSLLFGLEEVLNMIEEEGLEATFARHRLMRDMIRAGMRALGLALLTDDRDASPTVTAVRGGDSWSAEALGKELRRLGLRVAGGQQHLKGEIFRIGHMGYADPLDMLTAITAIEVALARLGAPVEPGAGTKAAEEELIHVSSADL
ncbi:pyridoxal-phosphate-dependent aminotransferase family protein [Kroppenstedtia eburnea]|uniref:Aspartate aminotransferase n=1 Tax=Kroppenstedtia eburnea TaxID=714067 RepID=A0A1N7INY1_9BACL|nr:alanine--glyoxylate aminotransferase family protein [Kroppenstedtia eburnea]QKI82027.1 alanine--glyoxylate aminotransferase family protein [Kroppenstedtia eburnea]SIS38813.1 aspartate aminotransferase [Kroppenstedtia eburnea]